MAPDYVLSDIDAFHEYGGIVLEYVYLNTGRAGSNDNAVNALTLDIALNERRALFAAQEGVAFTDCSLAIFSANVAQGLDIESFPYTATATYINSQFFSMVLSLAFPIPSTPVPLCPCWLLFLC